MICDLKALRSNMGLSQVKLSQESGVSLPTIQNIEAGKGNPTVEILEKLLKALGLEAHISAPPFDENRAIKFGVPLHSELKKSSDFVKVDRYSLKLEVRKWIQNLRERSLPERDELAVISFLFALRDHYSDFFRHEVSNSFIEDRIRKFERDGRVIKLRRIALAKVSGYL